MEKLLALQPESYTQIVKRSFKLYQKSFQHIYLLALILAIIAFLPRFLSLSIGENIFFDLSEFDYHRIWLFLINLIAIMFFLSILWRVHGIIDHLHESIKEDLLYGLKKLFYYFMAAVLQSIIIFVVIAFVLLMQNLVRDYFLPTDNLVTVALVGIISFLEFLLILYAYTLFIFFSPLIVIENKGVLSALQKSVSLVWNHWWRTFSVQITPWIFYLLALSIINHIFNLNLSFIYIVKQSHTIWSTFIHMFLFSLFIPLVAAFLIVQLKDLELRKKLATKHVRRK